MVYTRTGDTGHTRLANGTTVDKHSIRVEAYGAIDEAIASLGQARAICAIPRLQQILCFLSQRYFNGAADIATPAENQDIAIAPRDIAIVERYFDQISPLLPPLAGFILPGSTPLNAALHMARTITRRAERRLWELASVELIDAPVLKFFNRASDLLFVSARYADHLVNQPDHLWDKHWEPSPPNASGTSNAAGT